MVRQTDPAIRESGKNKTSLAMCHVQTSSQTWQKQEVETVFSVKPPHTPRPTLPLVMQAATPQTPILNQNVSIKFC